MAAASSDVYAVPNDVVTDDGVLDDDVPDDDVPDDSVPDDAVPVDAVADDVQLFVGAEIVGMVSVFGCTKIE